MADGGGAAGGPWRSAATRPHRVAPASARRTHPLLPPHWTGWRASIEDGARRAWARAGVPDAVGASSGVRWARWALRGMLGV